MYQPNFSLFRSNYLFRVSCIPGGFDANTPKATELPLKRISRGSSNDKSIRDISDIMKKKYESSQESRNISTSVQNAMMMKNREQAKLAMIQKIEIFNKAIDNAEDRSDFDSNNPSPRWLFATKNVLKLMKEYENLDIVVQIDTESFLSAPGK